MLIACRDSFLVPMTGVEPAVYFYFQITSSLLPYVYWSTFIITFPKNANTAAFLPLYGTVTLKIRHKNKRRFVNKLDRPIDKNI